ncbi:MAG: hypothetical protein QUU85_19445 [Candidatus Eisenbacteria bacterium]|nr:hypothetical protein [Candidatus Eisenbacteria bacterium]
MSAREAGGTGGRPRMAGGHAVSYTHLRAHETALCIGYGVFCL